jgi:hypothetical protein
MTLTKTISTGMDFSDFLQHSCAACYQAADSVFIALIRDVTRNATDISVLRPCLVHLRNVRCDVARQFTVAGTSRGKDSMHDRTNRTGHLFAFRFGILAAAVVFFIVYLGVYNWLVRV